jgi:hypothetical protein
MHCVHCDYLLFNLTTPVCPECGQEFDVETYRFDPGAVSFHCPHCDQPYYGNDAQGLPEPRSFACVTCHNPVTLRSLRVVPRAPNAIGVPISGSPWDRRQEIGLFRAWWDTLKLVMFSPTEFFRRMPCTPAGGIWLHSTISTYVGSIGTMAYQCLIWLLWVPLVVGGGGVGTMEWVMLVIGTLVGPPIYVAVSPFVGACLVHPILWLICPDRRPFAATRDVLMYSLTTQILGIIPLAGGYMSMVWSLVVAVHGVREVHRTTSWRAAIAVLWSVVVIIGLAAVFTVLVLFAAA